MIAAPILLFTASVAAADAPSATRVVVCGSEGCRAIAADRVPSPSTFDHGWVWSDECVPERADARVLAAAVARVSGGKCAAASTIELEVLGRGKKEPVLVRAGPATMWREVDEALLPAVSLPENDSSMRLRIPAGESWRARAVTATKGSWWTDGRPGSGGRIDLFPAPLRRIAVSDGRSRLGGVQASIVQAAGGRRRSEVLGVATADDRGELALERIPAFEEISIVVSARGHAPAVVKGTAATLINEVSLRGGESVHGRLLRARKTAEAIAVANAEVSYESWLDDTPVLFRQQVLSGADGRFTIVSLPPGRGVLTIRHRGFATTSREVDVQLGAVDLGDVHLAVESSLQVRVRDDRGTPIASATVACDGARYQTNSRGIVVVRSLSADEATTVTVKASRHLGRSLKVNAPLPRWIDVELSRAFEASGRFIRKDGTALAGDLIVHVGNSDTVESVDEKGFAVALPPDADAILTFNSRDALPFRTEVASGAPGGSRDLGALVVDEGIRVRGVVRSRLDGKPVHGARVWMPRPTSEGPLVAWIRTEILETRSDANGRFSLGGVSAGAATLRIDAPGCARSYAEVSIDASSDEADAGEVLIGPGATLRVEGSGELARVDPRGDSLDFDFITVPIVARTATLLHVPAGATQLQILRGRTVVCDKQIQVGDDGSEMSVRCEAAPVHVAGRVRAGEEPVREGNLTWSSSAPSLHGAIMTRRSPAGVRQQDTYGAGGSAVVVTIQTDGSYETDDLRPGAWEVVWSGGGAAAAPQQVVIPDGVNSFRADLRYAATTLTGEVLDREFHPASGALVREEEGGRAVAVTDAEGRFAIAGITPGSHAFRARRPGEQSEIARVEIDPSRDPQPHVTLTLGAPADDVRVSVTSGGLPAGNAFVLAENDRGTSSLTTTDVNGRTSVPADPAATQMRFAVHTVRGWHFGSWKPRKETGGGVQIDVAMNGGTLSIGGGKAATLPVVLDPHGWDVTRAMREIGIPGRLPLEITGLPPGSYTVISSKTETAVVRRNERTEVTLR